MRENRGWSKHEDVASEVTTGSPGGNPFIGFSQHDQLCEKKDLR